MAPPPIDMNISNSKISQGTEIQNYDGEPFKVEEHLYNDKFVLNNTDMTNTSSNDGNINSFSGTDQHMLTDSIDPTAQSLEGDRSLKPSRIPILKTKHLESMNSISNSDLSNKCTNSSVEDYEASKILLNASCIPTSPITGKKYRSPLSMQPKVSDRPKKIINGSVSNNNTSCDNLSINAINSSPVTNSNMEGISKTSSIETTNTNSSINIKNETSSGRTTPILANNKSLNEVINSNIDNYKVAGLNESLHSERKPRFKWMFGPHKNANVVCFIFSFFFFEHNVFMYILQFIIIAFTVARSSEKKSRSWFQHCWWSGRRRNRKYSKFKTYAIRFSIF